MSDFKTSSLDPAVEFTRQSAFEIQESRNRTPKPIFSISGS